MAVPVRAVLLGLAGAAASGPFVAGYLLPQQTYVVVGAAAFAGYSPYALAAVLAVAAALRTWAVGVGLAVALVAQVAVLAPAYIPNGPKTGTPLVVMTANIYFGETQAAAVVAAVRRYDVDVLGVQELTPEAVDELRAAGLEELLPHSSLAAAPSSRGAGLWSRLPLRPERAWPSTFAGAAADLDVAGVPIRVRVLHPPPPGDGDGVRTWAGNYDGFERAKRVETPRPTLVIGDFNASVHHRPLRRLMGDRWRDAGEVAGAGLVRTWGPYLGRPEVLDPDHVLVERGLGVRDFATVELGRSDHRAVVATVVLPTRR